MSPGKYVDKYTLITSICMSNRSCLSRCNLSNDQVFKPIVQVVPRGTAGKSGVSDFRPFGLSELVVLLLEYYSLMCGGKDFFVHFNGL